MSAHEPWFGGGVFSGWHVADEPHKQGFFDWESVHEGPDRGDWGEGAIGRQLGLEAQSQVSPVIRSVHSVLNEST